MKLVHIITEKDVGQGVYRHPMGNPMRSLLVKISSTFGGIISKDVGRRVYIGKNGKLLLSAPPKD